ncbi:MAG: hypothetical protein AB9M53_04470 [Leptothrix sp. (in: b-proteobacteria)]
MSEPTPISPPLDLVLISWDGREPALDKIHLNARPAFELVVFDYSGQVGDGTLVIDGSTATVLSRKTECKGEIFHHLAQHLISRAQTPRYVGLIDDDVLLSIDAINHTLHLARCAGLDSFSPSLSHDSEYTHRWTLRQPNRVYRPVDWVEVMMPFYRGTLFLAAAPHFADSISSWGIDKYLMPTMQQLTGANQVALIDAVMASHVRGVSSGQKTYRNGMTAKAEAAAMKADCIAMIQAERPDLIAGAWFHRIFTMRHSRTRYQQLVYRLGRPLRRWLEQST